MGSRLRVRDRQTRCQRKLVPIDTSGLQREHPRERGIQIVATAEAPVEAVVFHPDALGGKGENIAFSGKFVFTFTEAIKHAKTKLRYDADTTGVQGVGLSSGGTYTSQKKTIVDSFNDLDDAAEFTGLEWPKLEFRPLFMFTRRLCFRLCFHVVLSTFTVQLTGITNC